MSRLERKLRKELKDILNKPVISYNEKQGKWVASDASKVCQDHATLEPCPYHEGKKK